MAILLVFSLLFLCNSSVYAQGNEHTKITTGFSIAGGGNTKNIPLGSTIHHFNNGETQVYDSKNSLILRTSDADADFVSTTEGLMKANHVYSVPSGTYIDHEGNVITFHKDNQLLLTVIDTKSIMDENTTNTPNVIIPKTGDWVEAGEDTGVKPSDFLAYWNCPSSPPGNSPNVCNFLFTGIEGWTGTSIIQPVLQWNQIQAPGWTGACVYAWHDGIVYTEYTPVSIGDSIRGEMYYNGANTYWSIIFYDINTSVSLCLYVNTNISVSPIIGNRVYAALESYNLLNGNLYDSDMPGTTTFQYISITRFGQPVSVTWHKKIYSNSSFQMTGRDITSPGSSTVTLHTAN
jgi:hypothetical protein